MMKKLFFVILFGSTGWLFAQQPLKMKGILQPKDTLSATIDSMSASLLQSQRVLIDSLTTRRLAYHHLPPRSYFDSNPLFSDLIFSGLAINFNPSPAPIATQIYNEDNTSAYGQNVVSYFSENFRSMRFVDSLRSREKDIIMADNPLRITNHIWNLPNPKEFMPTRIVSPGVHDMFFRRRFDLQKPKKMKVQSVEKDPWSTKGNVAMQLSQNYTSSNWYQGGRSNLATLFVFEGSANYDNKGKVQWDNTFSMKMGIQSESADSIRHYTVTENQIRLSSKFGVKAYENWYYSISGELTTYSLTAYSDLNSETKVTGFLSPFRLDLGVGMDYKYKEKLSVLITPLSFKYVYFADTAHYNIQNFGLKAGQRILHEFGSLIKVECSQKLSPTVSASTRFSFYTNYKKIEADWETTATFVLTRYFSFMTTIHPRYDTAVVAPGDKHAKIQMKELMSFGFAYKFDNVRAKNSRYKLFQ